MCRLPSDILARQSRPPHDVSCLEREHLESGSLSLPPTAGDILGYFWVDFLFPARAAPSSGISLQQARYFNSVSFDGHAAPQRLPGKGPQVNRLKFGNRNIVGVVKNRQSAPAFLKLIKISPSSVGGSCEVLDSAMVSSKFGSHPPCTALYYIWETPLWRKRLSSTTSADVSGPASRQHCKLRTPGI